MARWLLFPGHWALPVHMATMGLQLLCSVLGEAASPFMGVPPSITPAGCFTSALAFLWGQVRASYLLPTNHHSNKFRHDGVRTDVRVRAAIFLSYAEVTTQEAYVQDKNTQQIPL